jgi:hypothetical protein
MSLCSTYFKVGPPAEPSEVSPSLWNDPDTVKAYDKHDDKYQAAVATSH